MTARKDYRHPVRIPAHCRADDGTEIEVAVIDISPTGCRLLQCTDAPAVGAGLSIAIGNLAPIAARVKWCYGGYWGLSFTRALPATLVQHLEYTHARGALKASERALP